MNLPNTLTLVRMFLVPLLVVVLLTEFEGRQIFGVPKELAGAAIFGLASLTDWLDGYIARRRRQITWLGQMLDPIADKLLTSAAFISLVQLDLAPAWMVALIIGREFAVTALRSLAYTKGITIPASPLGKIKMASQVTAILLLILGWRPLPWLAPIGHAALWVVMLAAVDIAFALDSIPTVVSLVREKANAPFSSDEILVIYSSNIFAILGLRSLFFLLKGAVDKFDYLQQGIALVLIFIGIKMLIEFFDIRINIYISLAVIVVCIAGSVFYSMHHERRKIAIKNSER